MEACLSWYIWAVFLKKMYSLWQVWALVVMFLSKKYNRLPHFFTINLIFAQVSTPPHAFQAEPLNIYSI